jgi:hypothetical protein
VDFRRAIHRVPAILPSAEPVCEMARTGCLLCEMARTGCLRNGTDNGEIGMVGGQSIGQLLSKDSGAREWKHLPWSAAPTP